MSRFYFEILEPRILFSADSPVGLTLDNNHDTNLHSSDLQSLQGDLDARAGLFQFDAYYWDPVFSKASAGTIEQDYFSPIRELVSIDPGVDQYQSFFDEEPPDSSLIVILDPSQDSITQITETLGEYSGIDAVHLISHGEDGQINFSNQSLADDNLNRYASILTSWQQSLGPDADIFIYGCNVAQTVHGEEFLNRIAELTGADVTASDNVSGHEIADGDWELEFSSGNIQSVALAGSSQWQNSLATPSGLPAIDGLFVQNNTLLANVSDISDSDGLGEFAYSWYRDGIAIAGATESFYVLTDDDTDSSIRLQVSYLDGSGDTVTLFSAPSAAIENINDAPTVVSHSEVNALEDSMPQTLSLFSVFDDVDDEDQTLTYEVISNTNTDMFKEIDIDPQGNLNMEFATNEYGEAILTIRATDPEGLSATTNIPVVLQAVNDSPMSTGSKVITVLEDTEQVIVDLSGIFQDIDNELDVLQFSLMSTTGEVTITDTDIAGELLYLSIQEDSFGTSEILLEVSDPGNLTANATVTLTVVAVADSPVAVDDTQETSENLAASGNLLLNDFDKDPASTLKLVKINDSGILSDIQGNMGGRFDLSSTGSYHFEPAAAFDFLSPGESVSTQIDYQIEDDAGLLANARLTVVVTGTNDLPVAHPDTNQTDDQHRIEVAADNGLLSNDTDKDTSDSLQVYSLSSGDTVVSPDESIRGDEGGTFIVAADGSYQFLLGEDFFNLQQGDNVTTSIQYTVVDEFGGTSSNTLSISVAGIANSNTQREFQGESYPSSNSYSSSITINEAPESNTGRDEIAPETVSSSTPLVLGSNGNESSSQSQASKSTPGVSATSVGVSDTQITNNTNRVINNVALGLTEEAGASLDQTLSQPGETSINARSAFDLGTGREDSSAALRDNIPQPDQRLLLDSESNQHEREISNSATKTKQQISIGYEPILISNFLEYQSVLNDQESEYEEKLSRQRLLELGSAFGVSAGISLGYAVWVMRSGILLSSLLGSLPIWRFIDPLQVLPVGRSQSEDHEDESLASIASGDNEKAVKNESTPDPEGISNSTDTRT